MALKEAKYRVTGKRLLQHNIRLADPLDEYAKELKKVSSKRIKTDEDHVEMSRIEFFGGLYYCEELGVYIPADWWLSGIVEGAKKRKNGKKFKSAVMPADDTPIKFAGPKDPTERWNQGYYDRRSVKIASARCMRTRPVFKRWSCDVNFLYDSELVNREEIDDAMHVLGSQIGIGDHRPLFGRFDPEVM